MKNIGKYLGWGVYVDFLKEKYGPYMTILFKDKTLIYEQIFLTKGQYLKIRKKADEFFGIDIKEGEKE